MSFSHTCIDMYAFLIKRHRPSLEFAFDASVYYHDSTKPTRRAGRIQLLNQNAALMTFSCVKNSLKLKDRIGNVLHELGPHDRCRHPRGMINTATGEVLDRRDCGLSRGVKELTLSGFLASEAYPDMVLQRHPYIDKSTFSAFRPETLRVTLNWQSWNLKALEAMSVSNLKVLKLPLSLEYHCEELGRMLPTMPRLLSLTITDIPVRRAFVERLKYLGKGILSCAQTLRELDLEMTNFNRPNFWSEDERFIDDREIGYFFRQIFPYAEGEERLAWLKRHSRNDAHTVLKAPLHLTKLRLKHISLPWYSFGVFFDAKTIKDIHLPYSMVDESLWEFLQVNAQLDTLTDFSYNILSTAFLKFLGQQSSLKELTFVRPQDRYTGFLYLVENYTPYMVHEVAEEAPLFGPDTGAWYPSLDAFQSSLKAMGKLKHLVLPGDMYGITSSFLVSIAASLPNLEHLELGFDYTDEVRTRFIPLMMKNIYADFCSMAGASTSVFHQLPLPYFKPKEDHILLHTPP